MCTWLSATHVLQDIEPLLLAAELDEHYGVPLDFVALLQENTQLASSVVANPQPLLDLLDDALQAAQVSA